MRCDSCFESECFEASKDKINPVTTKNYRDELISTAVCGDNIVEGDKNEICDGAAEGCDNTKCKSKDLYICYSPLLSNSRCLPCHSQEAETMCKNLYKKPDKTFQDLLVIK